jgi:hypothetical protein
MAAILTGMKKFETGNRAVLLRGGVIIKGTLFRVYAQLSDDVPHWMLRGEDGRSSFTLKEADTVFTSSPSPCFVCANRPRSVREKCWTCFDGYL